jgi:hypothetical protein
MRLLEMKNLLHKKEMVTRLKRQPTECEKIFTSYTSNKRLIITIYKKLKPKLPGLDI